MQMHMFFLRDVKKVLPELFYQGHHTSFKASSFFFFKSTFVVLHLQD